jgi:hypothetical protein
MTCLRAKFHMSTSNDSLVTKIKAEVTDNFSNDRNIVISNSIKKMLLVFFLLFFFENILHALFWNLHHAPLATHAATMLT